MLILTQHMSFVNLMLVKMHRVAVFRKWRQNVPLKTLQTFSTTTMASELKRENLNSIVSIDV